MAAYSIYFKESVRKDLEPIPSPDKQDKCVNEVIFSQNSAENHFLLTKNDLQRIMERIACLADDPRPVGCEKLSDQAKYRVRQGNYRIIYSIQDTELTVWVVKVGHRREVYRV